MVIDPDKDSLPSEVGPFLGIIEDFSRVNSLHGYIQLQPKPAFVDKLVTKLQETLAKGYLPPGDARSIQGKLLHLANAVEGRVARGQTFAFKAFIAEGAGQLPHDLIQKFTIPFVLD